MANNKTRFVEFVDDPELRVKEENVAEVIRRFYPNAGPVKLYRSADGRIGFQLNVPVAPGGRKRLDDAYREVMKVLGEKRGRPRGVKTVQTKLLLPEQVYLLLKEQAQKSNATVSGLVAKLAQKAFGQKAANTLVRR